MARRVLGTAAAALLLAAAVLGAAVLGAGPRAPAGLPAALRARLDREYPAWRFAELIPALRQGLRSGERPEWIRGDFDGDGRADYAVQIVRPGAPRDSAQLLLAYLRRPPGYARRLVKAGGVHRGIYLATGRRGQRGHDLEGETDFVYRADAIEVVYAEEARETCLYLGGRFRCLLTGD